MSRSSIPEDIHEEILLRLPVKSILCFKSVCKNWYALLSSRKFIKDHLNLSATKKNLRNIKFLLGVSEADDIFYSIDYASLTSSRCDGLVPMDYPNDNNANDNMYTIIGSCNGLILLLAELSQTLYLWNPSTRKYKKIIGPPTAIENLSYGLGYDAKTDNYKLVCIATDYDYSDDEVNLKDFSEVYTYTAGSWSRSQNIPYSCAEGTEAVLLNGALHWLGETVQCTGDTATPEQTIICFDTSSEKFIDFPLPEGTMTCREQSLNLQLLGDSLCLVSSVRNVRVDVWVMQSYGVRESWTKEFTITQEIITAKPSSLKFYGFAKNGEILIQLEDCFRLYDRKNNSLRILNLNGTIKGYLFSESYVESLVSVTSTMEQKHMIQDSHMKKISELTMEAAPEKEAKRKRNGLTESNSKRKRASYENQETNAVNSSLGGVNKGFLVDVSSAVLEGVDLILADVHEGNASAIGGVNVIPGGIGTVYHRELFKAY